MKVDITSPDAKFANMNTRAEGPQDDPIPAVDLKFECITDGSILKTLLGADETPPFWRENGEPMYYGLTKMDSWAEIQSAEVKFGHITLREVSVDKFGFKPIGGNQVELTCRVQARPSDDEYVALLHAQLSHGKLTITTDQADLFE